MKKWSVTYSPDKEQRLTTTVEADTYTSAYVAFMGKFPRNCEITEIKENNNV